MIDGQGYRRGHGIPNFITARCPERKLRRSLVEEPSCSSKKRIRKNDVWFEVYGCI
jgi:hypothetical protein